MEKMPYMKRDRLADVLALLQVLGMYEYAHRTEEGLQTEFQRPPYSAKSWIDIGREHPEFFRVRDGKGTEVSLIIRHAQEKCPELSPDYTSKLMETAIKIHDSQLNQSRWWTFLMPVVGSFIGALLAIFIAK